MFAHMPIIRDVLYGAASRGASLKDLCAALDVSVMELNDSGKSVPFEKAYRAWEIAVKQTGDSLLGLHLGETSTPSILGLIGHLMQSSPDLLTAYQQVCEHAALATDMFTYSVSVKQDLTTLRYKPSQRWIHASPDSARQAADQAMAGTLNVFHILSGKRTRPLKAMFTFSRPNVIREYERVFGTAAFGKQQSILVFKTSDLKLPVISYDKSLFALFDKMIRERLEGLKRTTSVTDSVRKILTEDFTGTIVPAEIIAARLNMSVRTFQRKLNTEGVSYRELSSGIRKELARQLLTKPGARVQEVARMLGYSEASALRKALNVNR